MKTEEFGFVSQNYNQEMIVLVPQLEDWGKKSANKTIALTKYFLKHYSINQNKVYISGYSGGGETLSLVLSKKPELYCAALMCACKWDGNFDRIVKNRTPIYFVVGENDEYYGSTPLKQAYSQLVSLYKQQGFTNDKINQYAILDIKNNDYFKGIDHQHGYGGHLFANDSQIMGCLFKH